MSKRWSLYKELNRCPEIINRQSLGGIDDCFDCTWVGMMKVNDQPLLSHMMNHSQNDDVTMAIFD